MKLRRILCAILAFTLLALSGCNAQPLNQTEDQTPTPPAEAPNESETENGNETEGNTDASVDDTTELPNENTPNEDTSTKEEDEVKEEEKTPEKKSYSILFIGNSYTYYNDMPTTIFKKIVEAAGHSAEVNAITCGGYTLSQFADPTDTYGKQVEEALTGAKKYDFVILQEQSVRPASSKANEFYDAVRNLAERIRATGATPILYSTWGRKTGSDTLSTYNFTNESMTWKLAASYQAIGDELSIPVVHVGLAFYDIYTNSKIELYNSDKSHPSIAGSFLAAVCLYAEIYDVDPTSLSFRTTGVTTRDMATLFAAAKTAVFSTPEIPAEYRIDLSK